MPRLSLYLLAFAPASGAHAQPETYDLWTVYAHHLTKARSVDLTFALHPTMPVWPAYANGSCAPATAGKPILGYVPEGNTIPYDEYGFVVSSYPLPTGQCGTQLDPP